MLFFKSHDLYEGARFHFHEKTLIKILNNTAQVVKREIYVCNCVVIVVQIQTFTLMFLSHKDW